ncbi:MAG: CHAT domain-containing protein [Chloracidobacterium sp.]|nr:CHAT domain-containing protein [Chloracidobacterium sp.]
MRRADLAKSLISAATQAERKNLLAQNMRFADVRLARAIRKACYAVWTVDPIKAQRGSAAMRVLAKINEDDEIQAINSWIAGISDITKARFKSAVDNLENAGKRFTEIRRFGDSAQTQVAKLLALAMLGRYEEAIITGEKALKIFVKEGDQLAAGKIEMNLSNIVSRRSLHHEAEKYCLSARRRFIKAKENSWKAMAENGLANTYTELNDFQKADRYYRVALETARAEKMRVTEAEIEANLGNLALLRGRYAEALNFLELSRQKYDDLGLPHESAIADLEIADIYSELNLGAEAVALYERVTHAFHKLGLRAEEARSRLNYGRTLVLQSDDAAAKRELKGALKLFEKEKNQTGRSSALLSLTEFASRQKNFENAYSYLVDATAALRHSENPRHQIQVNLLEGELHRKTGKFDKAIKKLNAANALAKKYRQSNAKQFTLNSLGKISLSRGENAKAKSFFKDAIRTIEHLRSPLAAEEISMAFFGSRLEPFENLSQLLLNENKLSEAFRVIESGRARSLLDSASVDRQDSKVSKKLSDKLKELRAELNFYYKKFDSADASETQRLTSDINRLETKLTDTMRQITSLELSGSRGNGNRSEAFNVKTVQNQLDDATTLIEFVEFKDSISAFIITRNKIRFVRDLTTTSDVSETLEELHFQFGALRYGNVELAKFLDGLKSRADKCLERLYEQLVRPIGDHLSGSRLIIVPVGGLNYVPFQALSDGNKYLIEVFEVNYAPSARVWTTLQKRRTKKIENGLLIGFADERIPLVANEIRKIKPFVPNPTSFVGKKASFSAFIKNAPDFDLIHLACHGKFRPDNPMFSSLHLADGWITVRDICSQKLTAKLVTLSACETGLNKIFAGEEILGLARGFLTAGADSLVVSLWAVDDAATARLMRDFYTNLQRNETISASLRKAQLSFIQRGEHPFYWSPFVSIGK